MFGSISAYYEAHKLLFHDLDLSKKEKFQMYSHIILIVSLAILETYFINEQFNQENTRINNKNINELLEKLSKDNGFLLSQDVFCYLAPILINMCSSRIDSILHKNIYEIISNSILKSRIRPKTMELSESDTKGNVNPEQLIAKYPRYFAEFCSKVLSSTAKNVVHLVGIIVIIARVSSLLATVVFLSTVAFGCAISSLCKGYIRNSDLQDSESNNLFKITQKIIQHKEELVDINAEKESNRVFEGKRQEITSLILQRSYIKAIMDGSLKLSVCLRYVPFFFIENNNNYKIANYVRLIAALLVSDIKSIENNTYLKIYTDRIKEYIVYIKGKDFNASQKKNYNQDKNITFNNVTVKRNKSLLIFNDISINIKHGLHEEKGRIYLLSGCNGSGKSTFSKLINSSLKPDSGEVYFPKSAQREENNSIRRITVKDIFTFDDLSVIKTILFPIDEQRLINQFKSIMPKGKNSKQKIQDCLNIAKHLLTSTKIETISNKLVKEHKYELLLNKIAKEINQARENKVSDLASKFEQDTLLEGSISNKSEGQKKIIKFIQLLVSVPAPDWIIIDEGFSNITKKIVKEIQINIRSILPEANIIFIDHTFNITKDNKSIWPIYKILEIKDKKIQELEKENIHGSPGLLQNAGAEPRKSARHDYSLSHSLRQSNNNFSQFLSRSTSSSITPIQLSPAINPKSEPSGNHNSTQLSCQKRLELSGNNFPCSSSIQQDSGLRNRSAPNQQPCAELSRSGAGSNHNSSAHYANVELSRSRAVSNYNSSARYANVELSRSRAGSNYNSSAHYADVELSRSRAGSNQNSSAHFMPM